MRVARSTAGGLAETETFALSPEKETAFDDDRVASFQTGQHFDLLRARLADSDISIDELARLLRVHEIDDLPRSNLLHRGPRNDQHRPSRGTG